jgi:hypothetical protein
MKVREANSPYQTLSTTIGSACACRMAACACAEKSRLDAEQIFVEEKPAAA